MLWQLFTRPFRPQPSASNNIGGLPSANDIRLATQPPASPAAKQHHSPRLLMRKTNYQPPSPKQLPVSQITNKAARLRRGRLNPLRDNKARRCLRPELAIKTLKTFQRGGESAAWRLCNLILSLAYLEVASRRRQLSSKTWPFARHLTLLSSPEQSEPLSLRLLAGWLAGSLHRRPIKVAKYMGKCNRREPANRREVRVI